MFSRIFTSFLLSSSRYFSTTNQNNVKVAVLGAAGGIGQPLCLLLKQSHVLTHLNMYDIVKHTPGVAMDVSHIETGSIVQGFTGPEQIADAVKGVDIIVVPAGLPRKPGMSRDDLFGANAGIIKDIAEATSKANPEAHFCIITNPVNSTLPIAVEVYKKNKVLNPLRMFGVTTLDISRSNRFFAELKNLNPKDVNVPVICGHSGVTIIPLISQATPKVDMPVDEIKKLIAHVQEAGTQVVEAKAGTGSATLAMAYAGARFTLSLARAMTGEEVIECTMINTNIYPGLDFFATPIKLGKDGVAENMGIPKLSEFEQEILEKAIPEFKTQIKKGIDFVYEYDKQSK